MERGRGGRGQEDAQIAREVEFAIPRELDQAEGIRLARDFVEREFVARGMVADLNVHWDMGADGEPKPHAHVMLATRSVGEEGFGPKVREWNRTELLEHWREAWAEHINTRLAELDIDARVDHRSLEAQEIDLEPQHKIGPAASRMAAHGLASERLDEHHAVARENGEKLLANPTVALDAITRTQATFTTRGRQVAFDLKDYNNLDHGYAATIHKSQGVTVDKVHVLATPGLDGHAAYVALSRHRTRVDLHYGQDDLADEVRLVRTLSRERAKDMASDYTRDFADRRSIRLAEPAPAVERDPIPRDPLARLDLRRPAPASSRGMFDGLVLPTGPMVAPQERPDLASAVQRFARATADIVRMRKQGYQELPHHQTAFVEDWRKLVAARRTLQRASIRRHRSSCARR